MDNYNYIYEEEEIYLNDYKKLKYKGGILYEYK